MRGPGLSHQHTTRLPYRFLGPVPVAPKLQRSVGGSRGRRNYYAYPPIVTPGGRPKKSALTLKKTRENPGFLYDKFGNVLTF